MNLDLIFFSQVRKKVGLYDTQGVFSFALFFNSDIRGLCNRQRLIFLAGNKNLVEGRYAENSSILKGTHSVYIMSSHIVQRG